MPYLASHSSRLDISEWSTFSASRSTLDRGRSKEAADEGRSSLTNGKDWKSSSVRLCRKFSAAGNSWDEYLWLLMFTYWWEDVGSVVSDVLSWQREWLMKNNNNRTESITTPHVSTNKNNNSISLRGLQRAIYCIAYAAYSYAGNRLCPLLLRRMQFYDHKLPGALLFVMCFIICTCMQCWNVRHLTEITGCAVVQHCCKGDQLFQWEAAKFAPPYIFNPLIFQHQIRHR